MQQEWSLCRVCLKKCATKDFGIETNGNKSENSHETSHFPSYSLFQVSQETAVHFHKMIMTLCSIQLTPDDGLPKKLCLTCADDVVRAYNFKINFEKSQIKLRKFVKGYKSKNFGLCFVKEEIQDLNYVNCEADNCTSADEYSDIPYELNHGSEQSLENVKIEQVDIKLDPTLYETSDYDDDNKDALDLDYISEKVTKINRHKKKKVKRRSICSVCKYSAVSSSDLKLHMKGHPEINLYFCDQCSFQCDTSAAVEEHKQLHPDKQCAECNYSCKSYLELKKHCEKRHLEEKRFSCDECDFKTKRKCALNMHKKQHSGEKQYVCELCPYQAIQKAKLDNHMMMVHTGERPFACDKCSYRCVSALKLREHNKVHTGEKPFLCDECDYRCITLTVLNKHKTSKHSSERNFACDECDFKTKTKSTLVVHKKRHSGEKKFACDFCSFKAIQKSRLDVHIKMVHTGERPFACSQCSYRCADNNYLKIHQKNHSIKRFSCDECGYSCHTKFRLKTHKYMHSGEKPHKCDMCDFKCTKNTVLRRHMERIHNMEPKDIQGTFNEDVHLIESM